MKKFREFRRQLTFVGRYANGRPSGPCWSYREGGGFLFGFADQKGTLTGAEIAYIYPDLETALVGRFDLEVMTEARTARVVACKMVGGILVRCHPLITFALGGGAQQSEKFADVINGWSQKTVCAEPPSTIEIFLVPTTTVTAFP